MPKMERYQSNVKPSHAIMFTTLELNEYTKISAIGA